MSSSNASTESTLIDSIRPRLHETLRPLLDESNPCLPILESTCQHILNHIGAHSSAESLAQVISRDHGLTCKVLQVANSIAYSPQQTIVSVPHAVSWLGLDTVRSLVAAAHLVEQLQHWPARQHELQTLIAKSLVSATYASELGAAIKYAQPGQLFTATLLYSIGDLAIAYQAPDLFQALQTMAKRAKQPAECLLHETDLIGVPRKTFAQALAQLWKLPDDLIDLFRSIEEPRMTRWQNEFQTYHGIVVGSIRVVDAMTSSTSPAAIEKAKRMLLLGSGLSPDQFTDLMLCAMDRGRQLIRSMGLALESPDGTTSPSNEHCPIEPLSDQSFTKTTPPQAPTGSRPNQAPTQDRPPAPIHAKPLVTLQAFQDALQGAKDLNSLLGTCVTALHRDAGFDRVGLALLNQHDSDQLLGRLVLGTNPPAPFLRSLSGSLSREHQFFLSVLKRTDPLLVPTFSDQVGGTLKQDFLAIWKPTSAIVAPLRVGAKPIGLIYCDRASSSQPMLAQDYQAFQLFFAQTTLCLNRLAGIL